MTENKGFWSGYLAGVVTCIVLTILGVGVMVLLANVQRGHQLEKQRADIGSWVERDRVDVKKALKELDKFPGWRKAEDVHAVTGLWFALVNVKNAIGIYDHHVDFYNLVVRKQPMQRDGWIVELKADVSRVLDDHRQRVGSQKMPVGTNER